MTARIELERDRIRPGQLVRGRLSWELAAPPAVAWLRLGWRLRGGDDLPETGHDRLTLEVASLPAPDDGGPYRGVTTDHPGGPLLAHDRRSFELRGPDSPYSFTGGLARLDWHLELTLEPDGPTVRVPLVVSPTAEPIQLVSASTAGSEAEHAAGPFGAEPAD